MPETTFTVKEVSQHFGVTVWRIRRLFEQGILPGGPAGGKRVIQSAMLPAIATALKQRGWLPNNTAARENLFVAWIVGGCIGAPPTATDETEEQVTH